MNKKKIIPLYATLPLLLTSCSNHGSHYLAKDILSLTNNDLFRTLTVEELDKQINIEQEFLVYFTSSGCSSCEAFKPDFETFLKENHYLTYRFEARNNQTEEEALITKYGDLFCTSTSEGKYLSYPSVFIVNQNNATRISQSRLTNLTMMNNTFSEYVHDNNLYFAEGNIESELNKLPFNNFAYMSFDYEDTNLLNLYNQEIYKLVKDTSIPLIISNYNEVDGYVYLAHYKVADNKLNKEKEAQLNEASHLNLIEEILK